jgi:signal transduction histidine kinase
MSIILAAIISIISSKRFLKPIKKLSEVTNEVAKGNFKIRIQNTNDDEIGDFTRNFNQMVSELNSIETLKSNFIADISHEFKTPLATIQGYTTILKRNDITEQERNRYIDIIINNLHKLTTLVTNILNLSKINNQEIIIEKSNFSLDEQLRQSILMLEPQWSQKNIEFNINLAEITFKGAEDLLQQIWLNIIENAIKFSPQNGEIAVNLTENSNNVIITVSDNGIGMSEETQRHIFDKFYQGETMHFTDGNGLGLSLAKRIAELSDGYIEVDSVIDKGSKFTVILPIKK